MSSPYFPLFFPDAQASSEVGLTREQLNAWHHIDRTLFSRLVFVLNRAMNESYEVFCFLYMLEHAGYARDLIYHLVSKPDDFINSLANEIVVCLNFLYNKDFSSAFFVANTDDEHNSLIPAIFQLTQGKITLRFIHQNRRDLLKELKMNMRYACHRALADLLVTPQPDLLVRPQPDPAADSDFEAEKLIEMMQKFSFTNTDQQGSSSRSSAQQETTLRPMSVRQETTLRPMSVQEETTLRPMSTVRPETTLRPMSVQEETTLRPMSTVRPETTLRPSVRPETTRAPMLRPETTYRPSVRAETTHMPIYRPETTYRPVYRQEATYRPVFRQEAAYYRPVYRQETIYRPVVRNVTISSPPPTVEEEEDLAKALEERTVFLTFSKGYPITEDEVRAFFTKWFGDVIESIEMQDIEVHGQALFAKMLLKKSCLSKMEEIVDPTSKNKYTINGKHVWARKYIPKFGPFASSSSSPI